MPLRNNMRMPLDNFYVRPACEKLPRCYQDCWFFLNTGCNRFHCEYRHKSSVKTTMDVCDLYLEGKCLDINCGLRHTPNHPAVKKLPPPLPTTSTIITSDRHSLAKITEEREYDEGASTSKFMMEQPSDNSNEKLMDSIHANDSGIQHDDSKIYSEIVQN